MKPILFPQVVDYLTAERGDWRIDRLDKDTVASNLEGRIRMSLRLMLLRKVV